MSMEAENIKFYCARCNKELKFPEEINFFGANAIFPEQLLGKKVWCKQHFQELREYLKEKRQEEIIPQLKIQAIELLAKLESEKHNFIEIIKQTKRFLTSLETGENIEEFEEQLKIQVFKVES